MSTRSRWNPWGQARRASRSRGLILLSVLTGMIAGSAEPAAAADPFAQVYPSRTRAICHQPRSGNAQQVLGFDTGHSFVYGGKAYWAIGDSLIDGNKNGIFDDRFGFRTGTIGQTADLDAEDCVGDVTFRTTNGQNVLSIMTPDTANGECLLWPHAPFEANGKLYFFYNSVHHDPVCNCKPGVCAAGRVGAPCAGANDDKTCDSSMGAGDGLCQACPETYQVGLGELTAPSTGELGPVRVVPGGLKYASPVKAGHRIYLFYNDGAGNVAMARVPEAKISNVAEYEYWDGSQWVPTEPSVLVPVASDVKGGVSVAYNAYVGRYLMVYTCGYWSDGVCARTAVAPGSDQTSLFSGWNAPTVILNCDAFACGHAFNHSGYVNPAHPERIYVSTAHWALLGSRQYWVTLNSVDLSDTPAPPPPTRQFANAERDFPSTTNWTYASYDASKPGAALTPLTASGVSPATKTQAGFPAIVGSETINGVAAPGVFRFGMYPGPTLGAARVWTAPSAGVVELSGDVWRESTKADGAVADVLLVRGATVTSLAQLPLERKWRPERGLAQIHLENVPVQAGDRIVFGVNRGIAANKKARYDSTYFLSSVVFDAQ